jgi:hypothetical protein
MLLSKKGLPPLAEVLETKTSRARSAARQSDTEMLAMMHLLGAQIGQPVLGPNGPLPLIQRPDRKTVRQ